MAHESFEDAEVADLLNRCFVAVKVDKEERPDIDNIYMNVCMALTGSGGWPLTVIMDVSQKPFFAGTYFPKYGRYGVSGLIDLLETVHEKWESNRPELLRSAEEITAYLNAPVRKHAAVSTTEGLIQQGLSYFNAAYDPKYGGFGRAPKFPSPHNLLFLLEASAQLQEEGGLAMIEKTLTAMAKGGIFDHVGFGFSRYSTDEKWLAPHFEKMLYDNALLLMAYTKAYEITKKPLYKEIAEKTITYILREMTHPNGGFYSAQDADSEGVEGKYYVLTPEEVISVLGETDGQAFCKIYDITTEGNFEGKNIPNQIKNSLFDFSMGSQLAKLYDYRSTRTTLHKDDKILTAWNGLMIAALADASTTFNKPAFLQAALNAVQFIDRQLCENDQLYSSCREGKRTASGFLDDYAFYIYSLLRLYHASLNEALLTRAKELMNISISNFWDDAHGGFFLSGKQGEILIAHPKETYDGAIPSGNSVMTMNLVILNFLIGDFEDILHQQISFMSGQASGAPAGHSFYLYSLLTDAAPERKIVAVLGHPDQRPAVEHLLLGKGWIRIFDQETEYYKRKDDKLTYYVCTNHTCLPPQNELSL